MDETERNEQQVSNSIVFVFLVCTLTGHGGVFFFFSSRRRHTRCGRDWSSDVCSSDLILGQHQTGEQTGRLFRLRHSLVDLLRLRFAVLFKTFHLANRLEIHLAIGAVQKWKFARQPFTKQKARDLTRFIDFGKRQSRQRQSSRRPRGRSLCLDVVPTAEQIASEFLIGARALHLIENELVIFLNRFNDLSELTHDFFYSFPRLDLSLAEINPNSLSTPGSRCRFATVSTRRWARRFCSRRCSISVCAVRARCKSLLFTTTISARSSITIFCSCNRLP